MEFQYFQKQYSQLNHSFLDMQQFDRTNKVVMMGL